MSARKWYFDRTDRDTFVPTESAQSHWGPDHLNGPSLVGLMARRLEDSYGDPDFLPARLTVDLFRAARGVPATAKLSMVRDGRRVRTAECELLQAEVPVARAILVQYRRSTPPAGTEWVAPVEFTRPVELNETRGFHVGSDEVGWTNTIADHQNTSRKRILNRTIDVFEGESNSPFVRAAVTAEATSLVTNLGDAGIGYINGDLTLALSRLPQDDWIGLQADAHWTTEGVAVGTSTLFDAAGPIGSGMITAICNPSAQVDFQNNPFPHRTR